MAHARARLAAVAFLVVASLAAVAPAAAVVPTCAALTLYGNAVNEKLCKTLSTNNLWVCELTSAQPDVHTTFNLVTPLHLTVRTANNACQGNSNLNGNFPGALALAGGAANMVCGVNLTNYVARLNAVARMAAAHGSTMCRTAFTTATANGRITAAVNNHYQGLCQAHPPCP
jgi:hypothetical protein